MAEKKPSSPIIKGDYSKVPIQLAPGGTGAIARPTPGSQLIWGGSDVSSPWGHLAALLAKSGGKVSYLQTSAAELAALEFDPKGAPGEAPAAGTDAPPKKDETPEETQVTQVAPKPHPAAPGLSHLSGPSGTGPLFDMGVDIAYQGEPTRIWAHPRAANSGPRPLIIYLHGINPKGQLHPMLDANVGKHGMGWMHMGKLAQKLITDGKVTPLAMAAPTHSSGAPWDKIDFEEFVNLVESKLKENGVEIDLDQIAIVGHSGAGGYPGRGMNKLADRKAMIGSHKLKVFGIADTRITADMGAAYKKGLADNDSTAIYAFHRQTGGWSAKEYTQSGGSAAFAKAIGATNQNKKKVVADEDLDTVEEYWDNEDAKPLRISIKVKAAMAGYLASWRAIGAYGTDDLGAHWNVVPRWSWWALPRFFVQTEADKKMLAALVEPLPEVKPVPPPPPPPTIEGGEFNIPPAAPFWTNPAGEIAPKASDGFEFAKASGLYYPVRAEKLHAGRAVYYIGTDNKGYGPGGLGGAAAGYFLANRGSDGRKHVGVDMSVNAFNSMVVAAESGTIVNFYWFFQNAWCLIVQCDSGLVINYGEIDKDSLKDYKLKKGDHVVAGQPIGNIRKMDTEAMLHFETYRSGTTANCNYYPGVKDAKKAAKTDEARAKLYNPTQYLLALAKSGR